MRRTTSVTIPDSVTSIGDSAFRNCSGLTSVTIPDSVTTIGGGAFYNCSGLTEVIWNAENCTSAGSSNSPMFKNCANLTSITIGDNVKTIPSYAFSGCSGLTSITISDSVTSIDRSAFYGCYNIKYNKYDNVLYLGNKNNPYVVLIKAKSTDITVCTINDKCKFILSQAFSGCSGLTSITIPDSVTSIGDEAFYDCSGLKEIRFNGTISQWQVISKGSSWNFNVPSSCKVICTDGEIAL